MVAISKRVDQVKGFGTTSFAFTSCTLRNALPSNINNVNGLTTFKAAVKSHILDLVSMFILIY